MRVLAAVADARARIAGLSTIRLVVDLPDDDNLRAHLKRPGRLVVVRVHYNGFEAAEQILPLFLVPEAGLLELQDAARLLAASTFAEGPEPTAPISDDEVTDAIEEALFVDEEQVGALEKPTTPASCGSWSGLWGPPAPHPPTGAIARNPHRIHSWNCLLGSPIRELGDARLCWEHIGC